MTLPDTGVVGDATSNAQIGHNDSSAGTTHAQPLHGPPIQSSAHVVPAGGLVTIKNEEEVGPTIKNEDDQAAFRATDSPQYPLVEGTRETPALVTGADSVSQAAPASTSTREPETPWDHVNQAKIMYQSVSAEMKNKFQQEVLSRMTPPQRQQAMASGEDYMMQYCLSRAKTREELWPTADELRQHKERLRENVVQGGVSANSQAVSSSPGPTSLQTTPVVRSQAASSSVPALQTTPMVYSQAVSPNSGPTSLQTTPVVHSQAVSYNPGPTFSQTTPMVYSQEVSPNPVSASLQTTPVVQAQTISPYPGQTSLQTTPVVHSQAVSYNPGPTFLQTTPVIHSQEVSPNLSPTSLQTTPVVQADQAEYVTAPAAPANAEGTSDSLAHARSAIAPGDAPIKDSQTMTSSSPLPADGATMGDSSRKRNADDFTSEEVGQPRKQAKLEDPSPTTQASLEGPVRQIGDAPESPAPDHAMASPASPRIKNESEELPTDGGITRDAPLVTTAPAEQRVPGVSVPADIPPVIHPVIGLSHFVMADSRRRYDQYEDANGTLGYAYGALLPRDFKRNRPPSRFLFNCPIRNCNWAAGNIANLGAHFHSHHVRELLRDEGDASFTQVGVHCDDLRIAIVTSKAWLSPITSPPKAAEAPAPTWTSLATNARPTNANRMWQYFLPIFCRCSSKKGAELEPQGFDLIKIVLTDPEAAAYVNLPKRRDMELREGQTLQLETVTQVKAFLIQMTGTQGYSSCGACATGSDECGPFFGCINRPHLDGPKPEIELPCANCVYTGIDCRERITRDGTVEEMQTYLVPEHHPLKIIEYEPMSPDREPSSQSPSVEFESNHPAVSPFGSPSPSQSTADPKTMPTQARSSPTQASASRTISPTAGQPLSRPAAPRGPEAQNTMPGQPAPPAPTSAASSSAGGSTQPHGRVLLPKARQRYVDSTATNTPASDYLAAMREAWHGRRGPGRPRNSPPAPQQASAGPRNILPAPPAGSLFSQVVRPRPGATAPNVILPRQRPEVREMYRQRPLLPTVAPRVTPPPPRNTEGFARAVLPQQAPSATHSAPPNQPVTRPAPAPHVVPQHVPSARLATTAPQAKPPPPKNTAGFAKAAVPQQAPSAPPNQPVTRPARAPQGPEAQTRRISRLTSYAQEIAQYEHWEQAPGRIRSESSAAPDNIAFSRPYLSGSEPVRVCKEASFIVRGLGPGCTLEFETSETTTRLCAVGLGKLHVKLDGEPIFVLGIMGLFKIMPGVACTVANEMEMHALLQITAITVGT